MPDIPDGAIEPGRVFYLTVALERAPDGYRAMADREALNVLVRPRPAPLATTATIEEPP